MNKVVILLLIFILASAVFLVKDYETKLEAVAQYKMIAPIVRVREKELNIPRVGGTYLNWVAYVEIEDGVIAPVQVANSPIPKVGACMPVKVARYKGGGVMAILDVDLWQTGNYFMGEKRCP